MPAKRIGIGVLGVGRIGKVHIGNLVYRIREAEVIALADVFPEELAKVAGDFGIARTFADYRELLKLPEIEAVLICTPTTTHYDAIFASADAGKHIFCEKPVELTVEKIMRVNEHVAKRGVQLMVGFNRRFDPNFLKIRETVQTGLVGTPEILRITSRDPAPPHESYLKTSGGIFLDMTIHDFDMARYLMGSEITEVYARAGVLVDPMFERAGDWDTALISLRFANGAMGAIDNSRRAVYGYDQRAEVLGSAGMVAVSNEAPDQHVRFDRASGYTPLPKNFFMERYTESYLREMRAFIAAVRDGQPVPVTGIDGLRAVEIGLAAGQSARANRAVKLNV
jgi:myo-inositol 2-dehydrogenase/D-chiro-inositol 1-dehydrogenase